MEKNKYESTGQNIGQLVEKKQMAYGNSVDVSLNVIKAFLERYRQEDGSYKIPESLLMHILLQIRIIDKQNRIFTNPEGDLMSENPYSDITGYGILGHVLLEKDQ